jgi:hypothetical protein
MSMELQINVARTFAVLTEGMTDEQLRDAAEKLRAFDDGDRIDHAFFENIALSLDTLVTDRARFADKP